MLSHLQVDKLHQTSAEKPEEHHEQPQAPIISKLDFSELDLMCICAELTPTVLQQICLS